MVPKLCIKERLYVIQNSSCLEVAHLLLGLHNFGLLYLHLLVDAYLILFVRITYSHIDELT